MKPEQKQRLDEIRRLYSLTTKGQWMIPGANIGVIHAWDEPPTAGGEPTRGPEPIRCICEMVDKTSYGRTELTWPRYSEEPFNNLRFIAFIHRVTPWLLSLLDAVVAERDAALSKIESYKLCDNINDDDFKDMTTKHGAWGLGFKQLVRKLDAERDALAAKMERLREYVTHSAICALVNPHAEEVGRCTCGLDAAKESKP